MKSIGFSPGGPLPDRKFYFLLLSLGAITFTVLTFRFVVFPGGTHPHRANPSQRSSLVISAVCTLLPRGTDKGYISVRRFLWCKIFSAQH